MSTDSPALPHARLTGAQLRVLAHPLRSRLLGSLRVHGPQTATALAARLRTNTGAASYHLRQLAGAGLVAEETGRGRGRERWWRAAHRS
ncbi:MAG TPA: helix-turn-helix domain-containing protein, partial [Pilimelia sp.]|nr:helix-turn-helix domain-containing protein [Pilimelia sp.]